MEIKRLLAGNFPNWQQYFYAEYREYSIEILLEALKAILFNTYIQFNGRLFRQVLGIPMGGNASQSNADLHL